MPGGALRVQIERLLREKDRNFFLALCEMTERKFSDGGGIISRAPHEELMRFFDRLVDVSGIAKSDHVLCADIERFRVSF